MLNCLPRALRRHPQTHALEIMLAVAPPPGTPAVSRADEAAQQRQQQRCQAHGRIHSYTHDPGDSRPQLPQRHLLKCIISFALRTYHVEGKNGPVTLAIVIFNATSGDSSPATVACIIPGAAGGARGCSDTFDAYLLSLQPHERIVLGLRTVPQRAPM